MTSSSHLIASPSADDVHSLHTVSMASENFWEKVEYIAPEHHKKHGH